VSPANGLFSNDPWADAIIFVNGTGPQHGNVSGGTIAGSSYYGGFHYEHQHRNSDGTFEYGLISTGFTGAEGFQYVALNKTTGQSALRTGRINVIGPIANDDYAWNTAGNDAEGNMLSNDQWADDFEIVSGPSHGEFYFLNEETGDFVYRPNEGFEGEDSFQYRALNTAFGLQSAVATVTIQIGYDPLALNRPAVVSNEPILVMSQLLAITDEAVRRWNAAGVSRAILDQALAQVEFVITDLPGSPSISMPQVTAGSSI
jgi:hypothetical protein